MNSKMELRSPITTPMLSPELWSHIFQFLTPNDLLSVIHTCPEWNELLEDTKKTFLLPLIIPSIMQHVDVNTSLKFRKISKSVKLAVDETLQSFSNSDDDSPFDLHCEESSRQQHLRKVVYKISDRYEYTFSFLGSFLANVFPDLTDICSSTNLFLLGHIEYTDHIPLECDSRRITMVNILPKFGHHVTSIQCHVMEHRRSMSIFPFSHFVSNLQKVPNLKRLEMNIIRDCYPLPNRVLPWLPTAAYDFPPLPKLVLLVVHSEFGERQEESTSSFVLEMLKKYSQQLTAFTCKASLFTLPSLNLECLNTSFPNMIKFHLVATRFSRDSRFQLEISTALNKLSNVSWRLEKLHLEVNGSVHDVVNPGDVLSTINKFHQSLIHLNLDCQLEATDNDDDDNEYKAGNGHGMDREMSKLKILITNRRNLQLNLVKRFLQENCLSLKEIHLPTNMGGFMMFREEGRWALEKFRSVDKVVFWKRIWEDFSNEPTDIKYTIRRTDTKTSHGVVDSA
ncbi:unnamed protein product [Orchesella dallaii]|uniref:F-box domain-containing protein n=1 Tax=Orchesella dallaii TaxID=48710 RepID=A0ABP1QBY3_9HEXA